MFPGLAVMDGVAPSARCALGTGWSLVVPVGFTLGDALVVASGEDEPVGWVADGGGFVGAPAGFCPSVHPLNDAAITAAVNVRNTFPTFPPRDAHMTRGEVVLW